MPKLKTGLISIAVVVALIFASQSFTTVPAGHVKVQTLFGEIVSEPLEEGLHIVNPLKSFDLISVRNDIYEVNNLNIPTQDRFNSTGNVTVAYRIDGNRGNFIKKNYGTADDYIRKTMRQQLRSIIRDEGRKLKDSRSLSQSTNVTAMQNNTQMRLIEALDDTGIIIDEVLIQDITFDPKIAAQILATQTRIQQEEERLSQKRIATTDAEIKKEIATGEANKVREEANAEAFAITAKANATKAAEIAKAEGIAEAIKLKADANLELTKSLTPQILQSMALENESILFSKSVGAVPDTVTVIGDTSLSAIGIPIATSTSK